MSKSTFRILFYLRKNYLNKSGKAGIMVRLTVNGDMVQFSSKLDIEPALWDTKAGKAIGNSVKARQMNSMLEDIRTALNNHYRYVESRDSFVTAEKVRNAFLGYEVRQQTLLELFKQHNEDASKLNGISKAPATLVKYDRTYRRLEEFMKAKYKVSDIALREIDHKFVTDFEFYLRTVSRCNENTTGKFMQIFRKIVLIAKNNGWITIDPFANYHIHMKAVDRGYLTEQELERILEKDFDSRRLEQVRDVFIFSCFTGLSYVDVRNLTKENIVTSFDGKLWLRLHRQKTSTAVNLPLLKIPLAILRKYEDKLPDGRLLPVSSNQKLNSYLKEIADVCGIKKNLTFHLARHTFATTTTLAKGVPIETVSKMLGHTNIKTTQIYARITNDKIREDMEMLAGKLEGIENIAMKAVAP